METHQEKGAGASRPPLLVVIRESREGRLCYIKAVEQYTCLTEKTVKY